MEEKMAVQQINKTRRNH